MAESYPKGKKTLWEKEKLLVMSNFSFSHSVFKRLVSQGRQKASLCRNELNVAKMVTSIFSFSHSVFQSLVLYGCCKSGFCGKELNFECLHDPLVEWDLWPRHKSFPNKSWFLRLCSTSFFKTLWEKEKLFITSNFSSFHNVFYPFGEISAISIQSEIVVCKLVQFRRV